MRRRPVSLRFRLAAAAGGLAALAIVAAVLATYGVRQALRLGDDAAGSQRRIDAYSTLSARVTEVVLTPADQRAGAVRAVLDDFGRLDQMVGADIASVSADAARSRAALGQALGRMRGAFLRLTQGQLELDPRPGNLDAVLDAALEDVRPLLMRANFAVERKRSAAHINADPDGIRQILGGIIGNAVKMRRSSGIALRTLRGRGFILETC